MNTVRIAHLRIGYLVGNPEVGNPDPYQLSGLPTFIITLFMCCPGLIWPLKVWCSHVQCILKQYSRFCYFIFIFQWTESFEVAQVSRGQIIYVWFRFLERRKARTTGGQSQILRLSRNQNQIYFPGLTFSRDVVLWVGYRRIDTPVLDKEVKGCGMVLIPWEIKGLYCMWFIADLTSPEELWVRVCCRGWYEGDIEDGVGGWCFTTFLTFSTFYNVWLLFYNVQCVGYAFKSNLVAFVSIFLLLWIFKCLFKESTWEDE